MKDRQTIHQRIGDLRALLARHVISLKDVCKEAGLPYNSVRNNMRVGVISEKRMTQLEEAALGLRDRKKKVIAKRRVQPATA